MSSATSLPSAHKTTSPSPKFSPATPAHVPQQSTKRPSPSSPQLDITKDEFERLSEALKKEEFRQLFLDYVEEIQDPENRKRYEEEIIQIEAERGVDVVFIHPEPGFVIKTSQEGDQKCFINCAKNAHVAKPSNQICLNHATGERGISWSIPMAQAPPRDDLDNNNKRCRVYDVVFNPDALYLAERNAAFHKCLVDTALDAVEREYKVTLDRINIKFPKMQFKGMARPTVIRKLAKNPPSEADEPHPLDSIYPAKPTSDAAQPKVLPMKRMDSTTAPKKPNSDYCTPKYTIKHRRDVDLTEFTNELDAKLNVTVPRELVVDIELPLLNSSSECQLDVTAKTIFLLSERTGAKYRLNIELPFKVDDKNGSAKFDVDTRRLTITLPVIQQTSTKQREMHESLLHLSREDSGVESDMREDLITTESSSLIEELHCSTSANEAAVHHETKSETNGNSHNKFLKDNTDYQFPAKFDCNVLDNTLSVVLHIRNVQEDSIQVQRHERSLHLQFTSIGAGYYPTHYAFFFQLSNDQPEAMIQCADVEAWENNVILNVNLNQTAERMSNYLAGIDSDQLSECSIHETSKNVHKSRQRQKSSGNEKHSAASLDITIERSECNKSVEIEIKPRITDNSTCNANTTEDEDQQQFESVHSDGTMHHNLKKQNKKQKRKNKKRRSLSESACDDIKAYQLHQQSQVLTSTVPEVPEHDDDADDDEDSSPDRVEKPLAKSSNHIMSSSVNVPKLSAGNNTNLSQQRKQRSFSESRDSVISLSAGSSSYKGILKHYSRYEPRPSISDSCSSIDECSSAYSTSVDGLMTSAFNSLRFAHSFSDIPEENVAGLSESCKKTVRFSEVIKKQVFRLDSSILGQRKKNQKRRDRKQRALQRRLSEGDSADYEDNKPMIPLQSTPTSAQYLKDKINNSTITNNGAKNPNKNKGNDKKANSKMRARLESESSSDVDINKNSMMFEMDM